MRDGGLRSWRAVKGRRARFAAGAEPSYHIRRGLSTIRGGELGHGGVARAQSRRSGFTALKPSL